MSLLKRIEKLEAVANDNEPAESAIIAFLPPIGDADANEHRQRANDAITAHREAGRTVIVFEVVDGSLPNGEQTK